MQHDGDRRIAVGLRMITAFQTTVGAGKYHFGHSGNLVLCGMVLAGLPLLTKEVTLPRAVLITAPGSGAESGEAV
ncbi:MAG: hypothetical protein Kow0013_24610 [Pararhodobacter sp.]